MTNEEKTTLVEAANGLQRGMFVHIHGYVNNNGEKSNVTFHAGANYERVHDKSLKKLNEIAENPDFKLDICWNFWQAEDGTRHKKNKQGSRTQVNNFKEIVTASDPDFQQAIAELRKSITDPTKKSDENIKRHATSVVENTETKKMYFNNVLVHSKEVVIKGTYEPKYSARVVVIKEAIQKLLPIGQYRTYIIDTDNVVQTKDGKIMPRYEYISIFHETISSSSSSESDD